MDARPPTTRATFVGRTAVRLVPFRDVIGTVADD